jgi:hypothetical protein
MSDTTEATLREQEARIRVMQNHAMLKLLDSIKRDQDIRFAPYTLIATGVGTAAALFGAAIALLKWVG